MSRLLTSCHNTQISLKFKYLYQIKVGDLEETDNDDHKTVEMEKTELAFRLIDTDDDGYIDKSEFIKFSKNLSKEQVEKAWAKLDKDGDGRISISEFNDLMNKKKNPK